MKAFSLLIACGVICQCFSVFIPKKHKVLIPSELVADDYKPSDEYEDVVIGNKMRPLTSTGFLDPLAHPCLGQNEMTPVDNATEYYHNWYRSRHTNTSSVCVSQRLIDSARVYAKKLAQKSLEDPEGTKRQLKHDPGNDIEGENLCKVSYKMIEKFGKTRPVYICINAWYEREEPYFNYKFKGQNLSSVTGHFTMMIWKEVKAVGCAMERGYKTRLFVVCRYFPQGNIIGEFKKNIGDIPPQ